MSESSLSKDTSLFSEKLNKSVISYSLRSYNCVEEKMTNVKNI